MMLHVNFTSPFVVLGKFPDPVLYEEDNITRYKPGSDPEEKYLPSKLENPEKRSHNIPFSPSGQTAKNVGITIFCEECKRPRLMHSQRRLKPTEVVALKRLITKFSYVCGSVLSEYQGTGRDPQG